MKRISKDRNSEVALRKGSFWFVMILGKMLYSIEKAATLPLIVTA